MWAGRLMWATPQEKIEKKTRKIPSYLPLPRAGMRIALGVLYEMT